MTHPSRGNGLWAAVLEMRTDAMRDVAKIIWETNCGRFAKINFSDDSANFCTDKASYLSRGYHSFFSHFLNLKHKTWDLLIVKQETEASIAMAVGSSRLLIIP
jgi:hypothetical protein